MRGVLGAVCVFSAALSVSGGTAEPPAAPLTLRIVPSRNDEATGRSIGLSARPPQFHVVVTNTSDRPVRLWREWCSWGYFNLSFVVTRDGGRPVTVRKKPRGWDRNFPDATLVPPGEHMVWDVTFEDSTWQDCPVPTPGKPQTVTMKAVYEIRPDKEAEAVHVWTGRVSSPSDSYTLW
jgi:hypothetical protein